KNSRRCAVHIDSLADDGCGAAEMRLPKAVAENRDGRTRPRELAVDDRSADERWHAERGKDIARDLNGEQSFRRAVPAERYAPKRVRTEMHEIRHILLVGRGVLLGERPGIEALLGKGLTDANELFGVRIR